MSFEEEEESDSTELPAVVRAPPPSVAAASAVAATPEEIAMMEQFYANSGHQEAQLGLGQEAMLAGQFAMPALPPGHEGDEDLVAWDRRRGTYVLDDAETGALLVWQSDVGEWIADEEFQEELDHLGDDFELDPEDDEDEVSDRHVMNKVLALKKGANKKDDQNKKNINKEKKEEKEKKEGESEGEEAEGGAATDDKKKKKKKKARKRKLPNKSVYFKGLPPDATVNELHQFFRKAGVIEKDPLTMQPKIRIYVDENDQPKGDGLVTFFVDLAVENAFALLADAELRPGQGGFPITLEVPQFDATKKQRLDDGSSKKQSKKVRRYNQKAELAWDEGEQLHVILKYVFDPVQARGSVFYYEELRKELEAELSKCGPIHSLKVFERNPQGVVAVKFAEDWAANRCIEVMNGRWFDGRQLVAEFYDGFTNYFVPETDEERDERDQAWEAWLQGNDEARERQRPEIDDRDDFGGDSEGKEKAPQEEGSDDEENW